MSYLNKMQSDMDDDKKKQPQQPVAQK
jgi:hypothetical protein